VLDLPVSIGFNPRHNKKPQSFSCIDSDQKKPDMFRQKNSGEKDGVQTVISRHQAMTWKLFSRNLF